MKYVYGIILIFVLSCSTSNVNIHRENWIKFECDTIYSFYEDSVTGGLVPVIEIDCGD